jgi:hypothetical protein
MSEEEMMKVLVNAREVFLDAVMLASMNRVNLFTFMMATHSNLTGDPLVHKIFEKLNDRALELN